MLQENPVLADAALQFLQAYLQQQGPAHQSQARDSHPSSSSESTGPPIPDLTAGESASIRSTEARRPSQVARRPSAGAATGYQLPIKQEDDNNSTDDFASLENKINDLKAELDQLNAAESEAIKDLKKKLEDAEEELQSRNAYIKWLTREVGDVRRMLGNLEDAGAAFQLAGNARAAAFLLSTDQGGGTEPDADGEPAALPTSTPEPGADDGDRKPAALPRKRSRHEDDEGN